MKPSKNDSPDRDAWAPGLRKCWIRYLSHGTVGRDCRDRRGRRPVTLTDDTAYLVLVANSSTEQRVVTIQRFDEPALLDDWEDASEQILRRVQALVNPPARV